MIHNHYQLQPRLEPQSEHPLDCYQLLHYLIKVCEQTITTVQAALVGPATLGELVHPLYRDRWRLSLAPLLAWLIKEVDIG